MLNADADQIVVEDEGTMHPTELVSDWKYGDKRHPDEGMLEHETEKKAFTNGYLHYDIDDKPNRTENREETSQESGKSSCSEDSELINYPCIQVSDSLVDIHTRFS